MRLRQSLALYRDQMSMRETQGSCRENGEKEGWQVLVRAEGGRQEKAMEECKAASLAIDLSEVASG